MLFSIGLQTFAAGFTEPAQSPPNGNAYAPVNTGLSGQSKIGGLILNTGNAPTGLIVAKGNVGIGTVNPTSKLDVSGTISASKVSATNMNVSNVNTSKIYFSDGTVQSTASKTTKVSNIPVYSCTNGSLSLTTSRIRDCYVDFGDNAYCDRSALLWSCTTLVGYLATP